MALIGLITALGSAIFDSVDNLSMKTATQVFPNARQFALVRVCVATLILFVVWLALTYVESEWIGMAGLKDGFFLTLLASGVLNALALYFQIRALRLSDASLVGPIQLFTPVILLVTSPIMIGQYTSPMGVVGVIIIVVGGYLLGCTRESLKNAEVFKPFLGLFYDRGVQSMFVTACIWGVTANLDRIGVGMSSPLVWSLSLYCAMTTTAFLFWFVSRADSVTLDVHTTKGAIVPGFAKAIGLLLQMYAITVVPVPFVIALKRTSVLMTVVMGGVLFKEKIGFRFVGVTIMFLGVLLIAFSL